MHTTLTPQSDLQRPSALADTWGRYYTSEWVSQHLIGSMRSRDPKVIVELGAGRGALTEAAANKWSQARFVTVDMDHTAVHHLGKLVQPSLGLHQHYVHDALDDDLPSHIGLALDSVDLAICNPPYVRPRWRAPFGHILEDAGLSGALKSIHDAGADLLFIAQNLRLLRRRGKLGLVLPDGLITAEKFTGVRKTLLSQHKVEQVIQLPRRVFSGTEAQTYLMILAKRSGETDTVSLRQLGIDGSLSAPLSVAADRAYRRLDYNFHLAAGKTSSALNRPTETRVRDLAHIVERGSISSHEINQYPLPVFHLTDFGTAGASVPRRFRLTQSALESLPERTRIARHGDILVARIGRNLHEKVAVVQAPCIVSDCVFILRVGSGHLPRLLAFLSSPSGSKSLASTAHGVGARYLSTTDLLDIVVLP